MVKLLIALLVLAAFAVGAALVVGGRVPFLDNHPVAAVVSAPATAPAPSAALVKPPAPVALVKPPAPPAGFVVHDVPPPAPVPPPDAPGGLEAAIQRLRGAKPDAPSNLPVPNLSALDLGLPAPAPPDPPPLPLPPLLPPPDRLLTGPDPAPSILAGPPPIPPPAWTIVTSQGARWRPGRDASGPMLVIDMGGGRVATVRVDPAFTALAPDAASARVDFLKQTILESFPSRASQFRFARDGSVAMLR